MIPRSLKLVATGGLLCLAATLMTPSEGRAAFVVSPGYELFQTLPGTTFPGLGALSGVRVGTYNFGGSIGVQNVGNADTIIQRTGHATGTTTGSSGSSR